LVINLFYNKDFFNLALKWFRCETDLEVIRAEIHEMEADFNNIETNATRVMEKRKFNKKIKINFLI